jgi:TetR/AcrR family fatty acid metabolism transcriptional regulator
MGPRSRAQDKRDRILQAAVRVFADKGFYTARVSDVASEAGVADGTIYLYFESKERLLQGLFEESMDRIITMLREIVDQPSPPADRLLSFFERYAQFTEDEPQLAEILTVQLRESGKLMKAIATQRFGEFLHLLMGLIEDGQRVGVFRRDAAPRTVARAMFGALDELSRSWVMSDARWKLSQSCREVLDVFLCGLLAGADLKRGFTVDHAARPGEAPEAGVET